VSKSTEIPNIEYADRDAPLSPRLIRLRSLGFVFDSGEMWQVYGV
jgi:hypothetical protein